ncbi:hypothetical protein BCR39DRAFT_509889 [Naematelia encephala]|uniref:Uncharacterized protein n=1 Tax=Naematelia encephala TaxID=71784 RepID=A0A1Y2BL19_9TREE|nr:hypothetical protein BCR39DRAFT_509889 [Naematelia encephala]
MSRIDHGFSDDQVNLFSQILFIALFPIAYFMYRHFRSIRARFPPDLAERLRQQKQISGKNT